jgi:hypothetical protein
MELLRAHPALLQYVPIASGHKSTLLLVATSLDSILLLPTMYSNSKELGGPYPLP